MKKQHVFATALAGAIIVLALSAHAQQQTNGAASENTFGMFGDSLNGGLNQTGATGTYVATSTPGMASGYANTAGTGSSNTTLGTTNTSISSSKLSYSLGTTGGPGSEGAFNGFSGEGAWSTADSPLVTDYSDGGVGTGSSGNGSITDVPGGNPLAVVGTATSNGKVASTVTVSPDGLTASAGTKAIGTSNAAATLTGGTPAFNSTASGASGIEGGVTVTGPGISSANGFYEADGSYYGTNPTGSIVGLTQANGNTAVTVCPTGRCASASTSVNSSNQVKNH